MSDLSDFPKGFKRHPEPAQGNVDEFRFIDTLVRDVDPDGKRKIPQGSSLYVRGWALAPEPARAGRAAIVTIESRPPFVLKYGVARPDIALHLANPDFGACGFVGVYSLVDLGVGGHQAVVRVIDEDDRFSELARIKFEVIPSNRLLADKERLRDDSIAVSIDEVTTMRGSSAFDGATLRATIGDVVVVRGWAIDKSVGFGLGGVFGVLDDDTCVVGVHGLPRLDAAMSINMPSARRCGFTVRISTRDLKPGAHRLDLAILSADGATYHESRVGRLLLESP
jgi:hypothetical protein